MNSVLQEAGVPWSPCVNGKPDNVYEIPMKAPKGAIVVGDMGALEQLELWKVYQDEWCEHKPSMTCYYTDEEFLAVGQWLYKNFDDVSGVSFLPQLDHVYAQAPYEAISAEKYRELSKAMPTDIEWDIEELEDLTEGAQTLACVGGVCEI